MTKGEAYASPFLFLAETPKIALLCYLHPGLNRQECVQRINL